jgi:glycosyltransferase involved in cell wall biosynthesis/GT2 family glycosyltransferase
MRRQKVRVAVCIITYRRPEGLKRLLDGLDRLVFEKNPLPDLEIIVVDNDPTGSAQALCEVAKPNLRWPLRYCVESRRGIPYARNRAIASAGSDMDFVAFVDDDEVPLPTWMDELLYVQHSYDADVVYGAVLPYFVEDAPTWIVEGRFFEHTFVRARYPTGRPLELADTNNVLLRSQVFGGMDKLFDERFAMTGGSDTHFFMRVFRTGYRIVWAVDARVYDWVPKNRAKARWILQRAYRLGNTRSLCELDLESSAARRVVPVIKGVGRIAQGVLLIPASIALGRHAIVGALHNICYGAGRLAGVLGVRYEEYRRFSGAGAATGEWPDPAKATDRVVPDRSSAGIPPHDYPPMNPQANRGSKRIAFCGTRGLPARYGGFETAVDEITRRFVRRGYDCVVFSRTYSDTSSPDYHDGRKLIHVRGSSRGTLDTFLASFQEGWHLLRHRGEYDYVFWFNNANFPGILLTRLARAPMSVTTDGLEWRRPKWRWPFKAYSFLSSFLICRLCDSLVSDAREIQSYYRQRFWKDTHFIPHGSPRVQTVPPDRRSVILERYGLEPGRYILQITRFEPDNLPLDTALAFRAAGLARHGVKLVLVGYNRETPYARRIKEMSGSHGISVVNAIYDAEVLTALRENCSCYVHGNSVGGTNPALLEAMTSCPRILAIDTAFNREVLGDTGYLFAPANMAASLRGVLSNPERSAAMRDRVQTLYRWDSVAESYVRLVEGKPAAYSPVGA